MSDDNIGKTTEVNSAEYEVKDSDCFIDVVYDGPVTISLPDMDLGREVYIKDTRGNACIYPITIVTSGEEKIHYPGGEVETIVLNSDFALVKVRKCKKDWNLIP